MAESAESRSIVVVALPAFKVTSVFKNYLLASVETFLRWQAGKLVYFHMNYLVV